MSTRRGLAKPGLSLSEVSEEKVLTYLMSGRTVPDRTLEGIAAELGLEKQDVHKALRGLEKRRPQLAHPDVDATLGSTVLDVHTGCCRGGRLSNGLALTVRLDRRGTSQKAGPADQPAGADPLMKAGRTPGARGYSLRRGPVRNGDVSEQSPGG
jgi:hypothetical protein